VAHPARAQPPGAVPRFASASASRMRTETQNADGGSGRVAGQRRPDRPFDLIEVAVELPQPEVGVCQIPALVVCEDDVDLTRPAARPRQPGRDQRPPPMPGWPPGTPDAQRCCRTELERSPSSTRRLHGPSAPSSQRFTDCRVDLVGLQLRSDADPTGQVRLRHRALSLACAHVTRARWATVCESRRAILVGTIRRVRPNSSEGGAHGGDRGDCALVEGIGGGETHHRGDDVGAVAQHPLERDGLLVARGVKA
jgi:hypothetical protein